VLERDSAREDARMYLRLLGAAAEATLDEEPKGQAGEA
jgi:hypothetical protein